MLRFLVFILLVSFNHHSLQAQKNEARSELNSVLFSLGGQSWTARDRQLYQLVLNEVHKLKKIAPHTENLSDDFLVSRLGQKEASLFDLSFDKPKVTDAQRKKLSTYSRREVDLEIENTAQALAMLQLKDSQLKDPIRFKAWVDLLKRKYQLKIKSNTQVE